MSKTDTASSILDALRWRYATKRFDPEQKIPAPVWQELEQALVLSPSSYGMQPYRFVIVTDQKVKEELGAASWGQRQPADCSHLVVFARRTDLTQEYVDHYISRMSEVRQTSPESLNQFRDVLRGFVGALPSEQAHEWMARQCYIALGNLMTVASVLHVDNCPMEGFVKEDYDRILALPEKGCHSVVVCALGYRAADDKYAKLAKVRLPASELFINI